MTRFQTIRQVAATGLLPEHRLRLMQKQGKLPGIKAGTRFYINVDVLERQLNEESILEQKEVG